MAASPHPFQQVFVHPSQFPWRVHEDYVAGFVRREINHKFHYDSVKQSRKWLALHDSFSPVRTGDDGMLCYDRCFDHVRGTINAGADLDIIGLGCGGGDKDTRLLQALAGRAGAMTYYPVDVSLSLSLLSARKAQDGVRDIDVMPIVCDLLSAADLVSCLRPDRPRRRRVITFFGMIPNFLPHEILPLLGTFIAEDDLLLMSANLSPGGDYLAGIRHILPQYDNQPTRDWLITILLDAGVDEDDGEIRFAIEADPVDPEISRVNAVFHVQRHVDLRIDGRSIAWRPGDEVQLFFSYRYTTAKLDTVLQRHGLKLVDCWEGSSREEGVYLVGRK